MNAFMTHPSVRVKGTENNYDPMQCVDPNCSNKVPHMHCPFCVKTDSYHDPVILRAHYRVKHVDKGIDFAGLKVLRCCDHCDIVGTIKGVKEFKGAHWHCYKCKNGFNRRDEAIKHYRTHFRNPQTTFQIQVTQEVNQMMRMGEEEAEMATETITTQQEDFTISSVHPALAEAAFTASTEATDTLLGTQPVEASMANGRSESGEVHVSVAANETVDTSEGQTIMIIQEDQIPEGGFSAGTLQLASGEGIQLGAWLEHKNQLERQVSQLLQKNRSLEAEKAKEEASYKQQIEHLKTQVEMQSQELGRAQKREQELLQQLSVPLDSRIQELLQQLKENHEDLLHQQLAHLRRTYSQETEPIIVMQDGSTLGGKTTTVPLSHVQTDASGTLHIVMTSEGPTVTGGSMVMNSEDPTMASGGEVVTTTAEMHSAHLTSNLVTATGDSNITIVTDSAMSDDTHPQTISLEPAEESSILVEPSTQDHVQEVNIKDESPPAKRKKSQ